MAVFCVHFALQCIGTAEHGSEHAEDNERPISARQPRHIAKDCQRAAACRRRRAFRYRCCAHRPHSDAPKTIAIAAAEPTTRHGWPIFIDGCISRQHSMSAIEPTSTTQPVKLGSIGSEK